MKLTSKVNLKANRLQKSIAYLIEIINFDRFLTEIKKSHAQFKMVPRI